MSFAPFAYTNVLVDSQGEAWAVYRLSTVSYALLPLIRKTQLLESLAAFATQARGDLTIWRVSRATDNASAQHAANRVVEVYLAVRLQVAQQQNLGHAVAARILRSRRAVPGRLIFGRKAAACIRDAEQATRMHAVHTLGARPATSTELLWLQGRALCLGSYEPSIDPHGPPPAVVLIDHGSLVIEPCTQRRVELGKAQVHEQPDHLVVEPGERVFHAMLSIGVLPDGLAFPGRAELLSAPIETCGALVDAALHAQWIPNARAIKHAKRSILDADYTTSEQLSTGRVADSRLTTQLETAFAYKQYLESDPAPPVLRATLTLRVAAHSRENLNQAVAQVTAQYAPVHVSRPRFTQRRMWDAFDVPGAGVPGSTRQPLTVQQFAALMPVATEHVGTASGPMIGTLMRSGRPVRLDLRAASRSARPPSILCVGTLGSGKTITSQMLALQALEAGSVVVDVDPKPDHRLHELPQLKGKQRMIDLADTHLHAGLLDPLQIADASMREEIAASFYSELLDASARTRALIRATLTQLGDKKTPTSGMFIEALAARSETEAKDAAQQLTAWAGSGLARLALAPRAAGDASAMTHADLTSIRCRSLTLPASDTPRSDYTDAERVSCAITRLIAAYAMRLISGNRERHKLLLVDEAWLLLASSEGRSLIERINRTGRSENATLILATQQLTDARSIAELIGTHLVFGLETAREATHAADLLGLDPTPEFAHLLTTQRAGQALMRDTQGQLAQVQITPGTQLLEQLSTSPKEAP